uniref:Mitochondrial intermembrane space import and assembly protein 40-B n=1 Tax=Lygus hesperus TaxID=30085 RepID=A0A146KU57_LYGHE
MGGVAASSPLPEEDPRPEAPDSRKADEVPAESGQNPAGQPHPDGAKEEENGDNEERPGLIKADGSINWDCPCLGGMAHGPCGDEFRAAFSCFHYSTAEQKGSDCLEPFMAMQTCFQKYPEIFGPKEGEDEEFDENSIPESDRKDVEDSKSDSGKGRLSDSQKTSVQIK